jgi:DNA polymerase III delta prime subunit
MDLDKLVGQKSLIHRIKRIINNDSPGHAYAFSGPERIGKRTFALHLQRSCFAVGIKLNCVTANHAEHFWRYKS